MKRLIATARFVLAIPADLFRLIVVYLPGQSGIHLRRSYYGRRLRKCGKNLTVLPGVSLSGLHMIEIGDNVMIRENAVIHTGSPPAIEYRSVVRVGTNSSQPEGLLRIGDDSRVAFGATVLGYGGVSIGKKCGLGPGAVILSESFHYKGDAPAIVYKYSQGAPLREQCVAKGLVEMRDGSGIASNVIVLPGACIGEDSWVLPNSVVRAGGRVPRGVIAKGDPATTVFDRQLKDDDECT